MNDTDFDCESLNGWHYPEEFQKDTNKFNDCGCETCMDTESLQSVLNTGFYVSDNVSDSADNHEQEQALKEETKTEETEDDDEVRRMDPYDYKWFTKSEFYEWYGSHEMWEISNPARKYKVDLIWECVERGSKMHLSDEMIETIINKILKIR